MQYTPTQKRQSLCAVSSRESRLYGQPADAVHRQGDDGAWFQSFLASLQSGSAAALAPTA